MEVAPADTVHYGIVDIGRDDGRLVELRGLVEKPAPGAAPSTLAIVGRYILEPEVFDRLGRQERGVDGEIQLTDALAQMIGRSPFHGFRFEGRRFDCGNKAGFLEANIAFALERPELSKEVRDMLRRYVAEGATAEPESELAEI